MRLIIEINDKIKDKIHICSGTHQILHQMPVPAQYSVDLLNHTRNNYSSQVTRLAIVKKCEDTFSRKKPYSWQIDVTEALLLGLDCVATGHCRNWCMEDIILHK